MSALFQITLVNAACAAVLALAVALGSRWLRRPTVLHALWITVLLQLFAPPVIEIGLLPRPAPLRAASSLQTTRVTPDTTPVHPPGDAVLSDALATPAIAASPVSAAWSWARSRLGVIVTVVWFAGTLWVLALILVRGGRLRRLLRAAGARESGLEGRLEVLAFRMGVRAPRLRIVRAPISPLIRPRLGGAELLFPAGLLHRLDAQERDSILLHELAHVARRDHWVRLLELIAVSLFWWHPAVWWARSRLRLVEERCCDQLVLHTLPHGRSSYARGLLKTVEFLAGTSTGVPALASGIGEIRDLKERLTMILKNRPAKSMSRFQRTLLAAGAAALLLIFPTWSDRDLRAAPTDDDLADTRERKELLEDRERDYVNQRLELEQQAMELRRALQEIRERQAELDHRWQSEMGSRELDETQIDAVRTEAEAARTRALLEDSLRDATREMERAARSGDHERAEDLRREIAEMEHKLRDSIVARERERGQLERERVERELDRLRAEAREQREAARTEIAERIEAEIEALHKRLLEMQVRREIEFRRQLQEREHLEGGGTVY